MPPQNNDKLGNVARVCRQPSKLRRGQQRAAPVVKQIDYPKDVDSDHDVFEETSQSLHFMTCHRTTVEVEINGKPVCMEVDTGGAVSIMSSNMLEERWPDLRQKL